MYIKCLRVENCMKQSIVAVLEDVSVTETIVCC